MDVEDARRHLRALQTRLAEITKKDQEQEVEGFALPVIDSVINASRGFIPTDHPVGSTVKDLIDPDAIAAGTLDSVRAVDALIVVDQLLEALPPETHDFGVASTSVFTRDDFNF